MSKRLDLGISYRAIIASARDKQFLSYGDVARANKCEWNTVRFEINDHMWELIQVAAKRDWPLLNAIVVNQTDVSTGKLQGTARKGFIEAAKKLGFSISNPGAFVNQQQRDTFDWAPSAPDELSADHGGTNPEQTSGSRFARLFGPVLDALRSLGGAGTPSEVHEELKKSPQVTEEDISAVLKNGRSRLDNEIQWARFYLAKASLIDSKERGVWQLTSEGAETYLEYSSALALLREVKERFKNSDATESEEASPPIDSGKSNLFDDPSRQFWFVGAVWDGTDDQIDRFLSTGIWQNGHDEMYSKLVAQMNPGDRIAIKSTFTKKYGLPFDNWNKYVSCMRIKATGTVTEATSDGYTVKVDWDSVNEPREWYFYTYQKTVWQADPTEEYARRLIQFAFGDRNQDYDWWLRQPHWAKLYQSDTDSPADPEFDEEQAETNVEEQPLTPYGIEDILTDGSFFFEKKLRRALSRLESRKNLILQGPPGTGKTWLAKRLGYALIGTKERTVTRKRMRSIQFHPSISYEDFVRGWRPSGNGRLTLVDGVFLQAVEAARAERDTPFVVVIEEINRGNPAQIFGEMLTLLENDKRNENEAVELAYRLNSTERIHVPENLYVIGTMNIADRSLALVDLALRRRFAFVTLNPAFNDRWRQWCIDKAGADEELLSMIRDRIKKLNEEIANDRSLGTQFKIGHSYVTPVPGEQIDNTREWFAEIVKTEIGPLLEEYWFDNLDLAKSSTHRLLEGL